MKPVIGAALTVGDVILYFAIKDSAQAHQAHGAALAAYAALIVVSALLWVWVLRPKAAKRPASRPSGYPYGGGR